MSKKERNKCKKIFDSGKVILLVRHQFSQAFTYPTWFDLMDFIEESMVIFKDPDHSALSGLYYCNDTYIDDETGEKVDFVEVTFSLDS